MIDLGVSFSPVFSAGVVIAITVVCFVFIFWLELKRGPRFLIPRLFAVVLIVIAILGLLLRPTRKSERESEALLLTARYSKAKVDSLTKSNSRLKVIRVVNAGPFPDSEELSSYQKLANENVKYILGEGLPDFALDLLKKNSFAFYPCPDPEGVVDLYVQKALPNRINFISGICNSSKKLKLKLVGPSHTEDSLFVSRGKVPFKLSFRSKQPGLFQYSLISEDSLGKRSSERVAIEVKPEKKLKILFVQSFPSAEMRYLKNFLAEKGHSVATHIQTSKNSFAEEFLNLSRVRLDALMSELFNSFDLILADAKAMSGLTNQQQSALEKSVFNGLGLLVVEISSQEHSEFYSIKGNATLNDTSHFFLNNRRYVSSTSPLEIKEWSGLESTLKSKKRVLQGYRFFGSGKIGFQLLQETYRIALGGNADDYAQVWSPLFEKVARRQHSEFEIMLNSNWPFFPDEPIDFSVISSGKKPIVFSDKIKIPLAEDVVIDDFWYGKTWAGKPGWHQLQTVDSTAVNYFVHKDFEWESLRTSNSIKQTRLAQRKAEDLKPPTLIEDELIPPIMFFIIFLLAFGFLWLAPKI